MEQIGRYEILAEIGRGGMGVVYRARDTELGRTVAIKTLRLSEYATPQEVRSLRERLLREAQAAGNLNHPNMVAVHDFGQEGDTAYIVMELVEGRTLQDLLAGGTLPTRDQSLRILAEAAGALDYAHGCGAIHRDIKPANIMVKADGAVKIADFGIAKMAWMKTMTESGMIMGSPHYMAPEQLRGEPVSARSDQFGLAGVAYTILTGCKPFDAETVASLFNKILHEDPIAVQVRTPGIGPEVDRVLKRALSKNPADRFASCSEFVEALNAAWQGAPAPVRKMQPRAWVPLVAVTGVLLVLVAIAGFFYYERYQAGKVEIAYWDSIKNREEAAQFEAYLKVYPNGRFATQARSAIMTLQSRTRSTVSKPSTDVAQKKPAESQPAAKASIERESRKAQPAVVIQDRSGPTAVAIPAHVLVKPNPNDGQQYSWIPPGTFQMGCSPGDDECEYPEKPSHTVTLTKGFWMGQTEVTVGAYQRFASATGRQMSPEQRTLQETSHPMVLTTWEDAAAYCRWAGGRLPTEAEWEYAARAGTTGLYYGKPDMIAWYEVNSGYRTHPVRQMEPNQFQLYDMLGNAWERVADWFSEDYYSASESRDPTGPPEGRTGVVRGGSYGSRPPILRISYRGMKGKRPGDVAMDIGFRCVLEMIPSRGL